MNRRALLLAAAALAATPAFAQAPMRTRWTVRTSEGLDALGFLGPLGGKPFYAKHYAAELAAFAPRWPAPAQAALERLQAAADARGDLLWPGLALIFSGGPDGSIADLLAGLAAAETALAPAYRASHYWDEADWTAFLAGRDDLRLVLEALHAAGFAEFRRGWLEPAASRRAEELLAMFGKLDVIAEQERLLGRPLDPAIEIVLLWFCRPHGVKIQGQRFLAHPAYSDQGMVKGAAHEMLHPPFDMQGPTARACRRVLEADALFARILAEKDKGTGYNSLEGILNEDVVQALDQIVQERLGFAKPPKERWSRQNDQGMHVLAAGLYGLLKADGYDRTGGVIEAWMRAAAEGGRLAPAALHASAAKVLEVPATELWVTPAKG